MLALPDKGISYSAKKHNVDLNVLCDWIEASVVFDEEQVSRSDVIDILMEEQIYDDQNFASEIVETAWSVISRRTSYLSQPLGMGVLGNRIYRTDDWTAFSAYGFCLALSCVQLYSKLSLIWGGEYVIQGALFEELTAEAFNQTLPGWTVQRIGWSATNNPISLSNALPTMLSDLNESEGSDSALHINTSVKDMGLDLLAFYSFEDQQASIPVLLVQCASGKNWPSKRHTPDIELWKKIINFNSQPTRVFAMPFAFADALQFRREAAPVNGIFFDRYRLLQAFRKNDTNISLGLSRQLDEWVRPRIAQLPRTAS